MTGGAAFGRGQPGAPPTRSRWTLGLIVTVLLAYAGLLHFNLWIYLGVPHLVPLFLDTHAILSASDCHRLGYDVYHENPCDALFRPLGYSRLWLALGELGLRREHNNLLGFALMSVFAVTAAVTLAPRSAHELGVGLLALLSPAVLLGVERGNNDLVVFLLVVAAARLCARRSRARVTFAYALVWGAAFLKFYPVAALAMFLDRVRTRAGLLRLVGFSALVLGALVWFLWPDLARLGQTVPSPTHRWTFGARLGLVELGLSHPLWLVAGAAAMAVGAGLTARLASRLAVRRPAARGRIPAFERGLLIACTALLLLCFFANTNYDYRCVLFLGVLPALLALSRSGDRVFGSGPVVGILLVLWLEIATDWMALLDGRGRPNFLVAAVLDYPWLRIVEQLLTWIVLTALAALVWRLLACQMQTLWRHGARLAPLGASSADG